MTGHTQPPWVRRTDHELRPDPDRVVSTIFLPGQEAAPVGESRSTVVLERILALPEPEVDATLAEVATSFRDRHRHLEALWDRHFTLVEHRLDDPGHLSPARRRLIGAYFTQEYAVEGASLFNPSMVAHPDQGGLAAGTTRFLMSLRAVGEGHISSVEWRTGTIDVRDAITFDASPSVAMLPTPTPVTYSRAVFERQLDEVEGDRTNSDFVLNGLSESFTRPDLDIALDSLREQRLTRGSAVRTLAQVQRIAACNYAIEFPADSHLQERVLMPRGPSESGGMEDLRLVRLDGPDGSPDFVGTYTAYDGRSVASQLLTTQDFRTFTVTQLSGPGARNKGVALFPRQIDGRYVALSRTDRESNGVTTSTDMHHWGPPVRVQTPAEPWEIIQLGNCGPPIETPVGWLVLTHGVGPMREYRMGAVLLDLDDPTVVIGRLRRPLLAPTAEERSGYVPNVVYSCGAMQHGRTLVLPYGCGDSMTRIALVDLDALLAELGTGGRGIPSSPQRPVSPHPEERP